MGQKFKTEKTIAIHLVRITEVCGKVLSEKYTYKSVKTALLLSNVIDADHPNSCVSMLAHLSIADHCRPLQVSHQIAAVWPGS